MRWWRDLLDRFVPPSLVHDEEEAARARFLIGYALAITLWAPVFTAVYLAVDAPRAVLVTALALPAALLTPWIVRWSGSVTAGGNWITLILAVTLVFLALVTGGYEAPALRWLVAVPATAILLAGVRSAVLWVPVVVGTYVAFFVARLRGLTVTNELGPDDAEVLGLVGDLGLSALLLSIAWVHGRQAIRAVLAVNQRLREEAEEHRATRSQLEHAQQLEALGRLSAGLGHEINTPLGYVATNLQALGEQLRRPTEQLDAREMAAAVADAQMGASRIRDVVCDVTVFARGRRRDPRPLALRPVVQRSLRLVSNEIRHRARVQCEWGPTPHVLGDDGSLGQVFVNLLLNAAQAIPAGRAGEHGLRVATGTDERGHAFVEVGDTGVGIPPESLESIFDPFFTSRYQAGGTGLGLAICKDIVDRLGGSITVESELGVGSTFRVTLAPVAAPTDGEDGAAEPAIERARVLVVDDDERLGRSVRRLVSEHDVTVLTSGRAALEACVADDYDVILCDLMMPDVSGIEVHERLLSERPELAERMLFMTGGAVTEEAVAFCERMGERVLDKPFDVERLRRSIARMHPLARRNAA